MPDLYNPTLREISAVNRQRSEHWHEGAEEWSGADWSNAMQSEAGEAGNVVKKLRRIECGLRGKKDPSRSDLIGALGAEIADTYFYLDLLADYYDIDMPYALRGKFNSVSIREDFPERL